MDGDGARDGDGDMVMVNVMVMVRARARHAPHAWPRGLGRRAERSEDSEDLVNLRISREERLARCQLGEDAAGRPDVHRRRVVRHAQQHLRRGGYARWLREGGGYTISGPDVALPRARVSVRASVEC